MEPVEILPAKPADVRAGTRKAIPFAKNGRIRPHQEQAPSQGLDMTNATR